MEAERIGPAARPEPDIEVPAGGYTRQLCSDGQARSWEDAGIERQEVRERQRKTGLEAEQASCCAGIEKSHAEVAIEGVGRTEVHLLAVVVMPEVDQVGPMGRIGVVDVMVVDTDYMVVRPSARMTAVVWEGGSLVHMWAVGAVAHTATVALEAPSIAANWSERVAAAVTGHREVLKKQRTAEPDMMVRIL